MTWLIALLWALNLFNLRVGFRGYRMGHASLSYSSSMFRTSVISIGRL